MSKIIKNTTFLYVRMVIVTFVSLLCVRVALEALGVESYGVYNLLANAIFLVAFLNGALSLSLQRCIAYSLGERESVKIDRIYNTGLIQMLLLSIALVLILKVGGHFLFESTLDIPKDKIIQAKCAFNIILLTMFINVVGGVNTATIIANEDLAFEAYVSILNSIGLLISAYYIKAFFQGSIVAFSFGILIVTILTHLMRFFYVRKKYGDFISVNLIFDKVVFRELLYFNMWNSFGAAAGALRNSGLIILINVFFGPIVNASYAISTQINSKLREFSLNMMSAVTPQILKTEASGKRHEMLRLSTYASRYGVMLLSLPAIPLIFEMEYVLNLWLVTVPEQTKVFAQLMVIFSLINMTTIGLQSTIQALGKVKSYQLVVGGTILLTLPIAYVVLSFGMPAYTVVLTMIVVEAIAGIARLLVIKSITSISLLHYIKEVIGKPLIPISTSVLIVVFLQHLMVQGLIRMLLTVFLSSVVMALCYLVFTLDSKEKTYLYRALDNWLLKIGKKRNE